MFYSIQYSFSSVYFFKLNFYIFVLSFYSLLHWICFTSFRKRYQHLVKLFEHIGSQNGILSENFIKVSFLFQKYNFNPRVKKMIPPFESHSKLEFLPSSQTVRSHGNTAINNRLIKNNTGYTSVNVYPFFCDNMYLLKLYRSNIKSLT